VNVQPDCDEKWKKRGKRLNGERGGEGLQKLGSKARGSQAGTRVAGVIDMGKIGWGKDGKSSQHQSNHQDP